jgi:hypothetical protein
MFGGFTYLLTWEQIVRLYRLTLDQPPIVNVKPTPEIFDASEKWNKCGIAIMEHQQPR